MSTMLTLAGLASLLLLLPSLAALPATPQRRGTHAFVGTGVQREGRA
jgi:hypothetical protein